MSTVKQSQAIPFTGPYSLLVCHLRNLTGKDSSAQAGVSLSLALMLSSFVLGDVEELDGTEKNTLKVFKTVTLIHEVGMVLLEVSGRVWVPSGGPDFSLIRFDSIQRLFTTSVSPSVCSLSRLYERPLTSPHSYLLFQWIANPINDMYADAIATVVLEVQSNPKALKGLFLFLRHVDLLLNNMCLGLFPPDLFFSHGDAERHNGHYCFPSTTGSHVTVRVLSHICSYEMFESVFLNHLAV